MRFENSWKEKDKQIRFKDSIGLMALMLCVYGEPSEDGYSRVYHPPEECISYILTGSYMPHGYEAKKEKKKKFKETKGEQLLFFEVH